MCSLDLIFYDTPTRITKFTIERLNPRSNARGQKRVPSAYSAEGRRQG